MPEKDDYELIAEFLAGQSDSFERLMTRYRERVGAFSQKMCRQADDAQDVFQETFLAAFQKIKDFRGEGKLKNWLFKIASNVCLKKRLKGKFDPHLLSIDQMPLADGEIGQAEIPDSSAIPDDMLMNKELKEKLDEAIYALPKKYRLVLLLRDFEGFSTEEVGEMLGLSESAVKVRLHRARMNVRKKLEPY
jgi:RNA polymerase sigma-70 factor (ECF subfamily)